MRKAGKLCQDAMDAMVARAKPGVKEYELRAAAGAAILDGGGDIDFLIIGSTPMANPALIFGNPRPSGARAAEGRHHQHGTRRRLSRLHRADRLTDLRRRADRDGEEILERDHAARLQAHHRRDRAGQDRSKPCARPASSSATRATSRGRRRCHGIDLVTDKPHVVAEHVSAEKFEEVLKARHGDHGRAQPDHAGRPVRHFPRPHLHRHRERATRCVDDFPLEIAVARG